MSTFVDLNDKINFCFDDPTKNPAAHKRGSLASVLYLLRRELIETTGYDPAAGDTECTVDTGGVRNRLFVSLIAVFTGFDLLAKFQRGDTECVGDRFKNFLKSPDGAALDPAAAKLFYAVRNSLTHAFGTPDADALARLGLKGVTIGQRKEGNWGGWRGLVAVERQPEYAVIYIDGVFRTFKEAIVKYRESLYDRDADQARSTFEQMFDKYGTINWV